MSRETAGVKCSKRADRETGAPCEYCCSVEGNSASWQLWMRMS